jgi:hypothetical protein
MLALAFISSSFFCGFLELKLSSSRYEHRPTRKSRISGKHMLELCSRDCAFLFRLSEVCATFIAGFEPANLENSPARSLYVPNPSELY